MNDYPTPRTPAFGAPLGVSEGRAYAFAAQDYGADRRCTFRAARFGAFWSLLLALSDPEPSGVIASRFLAVTRRPIAASYRSWTDQGEFYCYENADGHWAIVPATDGLSELDVCVLPVPGVSRYFRGEPGRQEYGSSPIERLADRVAGLAGCAGWTTATTLEVLIGYLQHTSQAPAVLRHLDDVAAGADSGQDPPVHRCPYRCGYDTCDETALVHHVNDGRCPHASPR